jgi:hypothetical protein
MKSYRHSACLLLMPGLIIALTLSTIAPSSSAGPALPAEEALRISPDHDHILFGAVVGAPASRDTFLVMGPWGSSAPFNGQFQTPDGTPAWNGWTSIDLTQKTTSAWHVDTYNAENLNSNGAGNRAAWCGSMVYPSCDPLDPEGGYGNDYEEILNWAGTVADNTAPCTVTVDAWVNHHLEPGYDWVKLLFLTANPEPFEAWFADGLGSNVRIVGSYTYSPAEYLGEGHNQVLVRWLVTSDGAVADEDCSWHGNGACQIDDITVTMDNGAATTFDDFENGTLGNWEIGYPTGAGDFASLRENLNDLDPCGTNLSSQVTFIDDGLVVPGTGGSPCINWCYGPGGYIVNPIGGLGDLWSTPVNNAVDSPVMPLLGDTDGCQFSFDVYVHEALTTCGSPGIFYNWKIRSTASADPGAIESEEWLDRGLLYYGTPSYRRAVNNVSDLLNPGARFVQVRLEVDHVFNLWTWCPSVDGSPAPYFDNVRVEAFDIEGPALHAYAKELAQDGFPANGQVDLADLGRNSVRFDRADGLIDNIRLYAEPLSPGATMVGPPQMNYHLAANPVFNGVRTSGLPNVGSVLGVLNPAASGGFLFDLPDTGFFFPGDVLHYYFEATDDLAGDLRTAFLPADTTGFSDFDRPLAYPGAFTVRALPSVHHVEELLTAPNVLLWDNTGDPEVLDEWYAALANLGLHPGREFEVFASKSPARATGNGLAGLATTMQLAFYDVLLYSGGTLGREGIGFSGSPLETSPDLVLLDEWLRLGSRGALLTGDRLAENLDPNEIGDPFLTYWAGVEYQEQNLRPLIDDQWSPDVLALPSNPVLSTVDRWIVYGMCPHPATLNGIVAAGTGVSFAEYIDDDGETTYPYSAGVWNLVPEFSSQLVTLPYDFSRIGTVSEVTANKAEGQLAARTRMLANVLNRFGHAGGSLPTPVPRLADQFAVAAYPNPFNPTTRIEFNLPERAHLSLKVFDLRGALIRILIDEARAAGSDYVDWNGADESGARVSSGVYFYVITAGEESRSGRVMLLK